MNKHLTYDEYFDTYYKPTLIYKNYFDQTKEIDKLQSNWNSLREWLETLKDSSLYSLSFKEPLINVLDKMNELEGVDND